MRSGAGALKLRIWVKLLGSSQPLQVTSGPEVKFWPIWSPDGRRIRSTAMRSKPRVDERVHGKRDAA
jgi:Tol biopolymer transport system component